MVLALGDVGNTVVWTASSPEMRKVAENVHLIEGGQWREELVGTNALALSIKTQQSSCVFSSEHYMPSVQDMACYAAPIIDPYSKHILGVVALSTEWQKHNKFWTTGSRTLCLHYSICFIGITKTAFIYSCLFCPAGHF